MSRILAISGSARQASLNRKTLAALTRLLREKDADVELLDLAELDMPIYHGDLEAEHGLPDGAVRLRRAMVHAAGWVVACPEYNGFITPLLLNALDWASRSETGRPDLTPFVDKVVLVASASPGAFGGSRAAGHLRNLLSGIGCIVVPQTITVPAAGQAFNDSGDLADERLAARARQAVDKLLDLAEKLRPPETSHE